MPAKAQVDPFAAVATEVVAADPDLQRRLKRIIRALIKDAEWTIRNGTPSDRQNLMRSVIPQLMKSLATVDTTETEKAEKSALERIMAGLRGEEDE